MIKGGDSRMTTLETLKLFSMPGMTPTGAPDPPFEHSMAHLMVQKGLQPLLAAIDPKLPGHDHTTPMPVTGGEDSALPSSTPGHHI